MEKQFESKAFWFNSLRFTIRKIRFLFFFFPFSIQKSKGYDDVEIETLFAKYDMDGDRCLNQEEQKNMLKDLCKQNDDLKQAYLMLDQASAEYELSFSFSLFVVI